MNRAGSQTFVFFLLVFLTFFAENASSAVRDLEFSSDGRFLATLTSEGSLYVNDVKSGNMIYSLEKQIKGNNVAWRPGTDKLAVTLDEGEGWDIWLIDNGGNRQRLTEHPARDCSPQWINDGKTLVFVSDRKEDADLYQLSLDLPKNQPQPFVVRPHDQWHPLAQPHGGSVIYLSLEGGQIDLWLAAEGQEPYRIGSLDPFHQFTGSEQFAWERSGRGVVYVEQLVGKMRLHVFDIQTRKDAVLFERDQVLNPLLDSGRGWLLYDAKRGLTLQRLKGFHPLGIGRTELLTLDGLRLGLPTFGEKDGGLLSSFEVENRASCLGVAPADDLEFLYFQMNDYLFYAERLFKLREYRTAETLYGYLDQHLKKPEERMTVGIHHAGLLREDNHPNHALNELNRAAQGVPSGTDLSRLYALQGEIYFYELRDYEKAQLLFHMAESFAPGEESEPLEPLEVLKTNNRRLIRLYAEAHAAKRGGDFGEALKAMAKLAKLDPANLMIQNAILDLLDNPYEKERVAAQQNPYEDPKRLNDVIGVLERLASAAVAGDKDNAGGEKVERVATTERLRQQLLQALIRTKRFPAARKVALDILAANGLDGLGAMDFLHYYVETDRRDRKADEFLSQILLAPPVVTELEPLLKEDVIGQALLALSRIKLALQAGELKTASALLFEAFKAFESTWVTNRGETTQLRFYLFLYAARIYERENLWDKAQQAYRTGITLASKYNPDRIDIYQDLESALEEDEYGRQNIKYLQQLQAIQRDVGAELLAPTNDPEEIRAGIANLVELLRASSPSPLDTFILFQIGRTLGRSKMPAAGIHYLDRALQANPPVGLRVAILWEKTSVLHEAEEFWGEQNILLSLLRLPVTAAQKEAAQLKLAATYLALGQTAEGRKILEKLSGTATIKVFRENAARELQGIDSGGGLPGRDQED